VPRIALSPAEAAEAVGVSERTIRRWLREGTVRYSRVNGRVLILVEHLRETITAHEERACQAAADLRTSAEHALRLAGRSRDRVHSQ
jgi:excisionase family DNA binding protein